MSHDLSGLNLAISTGIKRSIGSGKPEAVLRQYVQPALEEILWARGVRPSARDEVSLSVPDLDAASMLDAPLDSRGRADAVYNRFVIEFEPPGSLRPSVKHFRTRHAVAQVQQYLRGVAEEASLPLDRLAGCAFDGTWIVYVTWARGEWQIEAPLRSNHTTLAALIETLESLASGRGLTATNLYEDFGRESEAVKKVVGAFCDVFGSGKATGRTLTLFDQWSLDLGNASGPFSSSDLDEWTMLCEALEVSASEGSSLHVLFCLQTYFSIVAKLTALVILEGATGVSLVDKLTVGGDVVEGFSLLESGELTSDTGTLNVIEPGLFSWYLGEKSEHMLKALSCMAELAAEYSAEIVEITPPVARDLLKDLYQQLLPSSIRHRLGEYYTPDWLAQRVVNQVTGSPERLDPSKRLLDPACGSGTFLAEVISRMVKSARDQSPNRTLQQIVENVVGFDLSPLAVQAAKVNYLLSLAPLLRYAEEPVSLPVYLADSVAPPRQGCLLEGDVFLFDSSEGEWRVPSSLAAAQYLPILGEIFDEALAQGRDAHWVRKQLGARVPIVDDLDQQIVDDVLGLFDKILDLHKAGRDGLWWKLITNAFAPALQEPFDFVVGNPPWVSWETLPAIYREENEELWHRYGLRPEAPLSRRQSSRNVRLDIAMLFVAVCMDKYLREGGQLGFVITSSVFRSELAGRGFRKRRLPSDEIYQFVHIDDMSNLRVFEGPQNQTSVLVAQRNHRNRAQISVSRWTGNGTNTIPTNAELPVIRKITTRRNLYAEPVDPADPASPLLTMPRIGLSVSYPLRRESPYLEVIREGVNTRGANGVFFLEALDDRGGTVLVQNLPSAGRNPRIPRVQREIEKDVVRKLLRGADVLAGSATPTDSILFFHDDQHVSRPLDPCQVQRDFPEAFAFAQVFETELRRRRKFRGFDPSGSDWLGLYSVTTAALASHKVVVREIASGMVAAPVHGADIVPDHKLHIIPCDTALEADRLSEVLNCRVVDYVLRSFSNSTSITGSFLRYIGIRDLSTVDLSLSGDEFLAEAMGLSIDQFRALDNVARAELP